MDYSSWIANLQGRGFNTTGLSSGEANFADYGHALNDDLKNQISQNGKTQADKDLLALVASLFGGKSVMQYSDFINVLKSKGLNVSVEYVSTSYIVDEKQSGTKGAKNVTRGSIAVYQISDGKGGKLTIADANGNAAIEIEEVFMNEILSGVASDIKGDGSGTGMSAEEQARIKALEAQQATLEKQIKDAEASKSEAEAEIERNKKEAEIEIERIDKEIEKTNEETKEQIAKLQNDAANYSKEEYAAKMASIEQSGTSKIDVLNSNRSAIQENLNQINAAATEIVTLNQQIITDNATLKDVSAQLSQASGKTPEAAATKPNAQQEQVAGYAAAQGANGSKAKTAAQDYNALMLNLSKQNAFSTQKGTTAQIEVAQNANIAGATGLSEIQNIEDTKKAEETKKEKEAEVAKEEQAKKEEEKLKEEKIAA